MIEIKHLTKVYKPVSYTHLMRQDKKEGVAEKGGRKEARKKETD